MLPSDICRTCALNNVCLLPLSTCLERDASKSFYDVLQELTQIDTRLESSNENLPQHLCTDCWTRLDNAYAFVEQAKRVNGELLARLRECLDEMPIDIPPEQNIKTEVDLDDEANKSEEDVDSTGMAKLELKWQPESDSDEEFVDAALSDKEEVDKKPYHLRRSSRKDKQAPLESEDEDVKPSESSPIKRRRGRPPGRAKSQSMTSDGRHACEVCDKTFSWYRDMQRHARIHFEKASYVCDTCGKGFLRKDKYMFHLRCHKKREAKWKALQVGKQWRFAERLYSSGRLKKIECKLCGLSCQRMEELRIHINTHVNVESLADLRKDSDVVREHFAGLSCDLDTIKQKICSDVAEGLSEKFACIVNFYGYEMGLNDSDEESASEESKYNCFVCNLSFTRKHRLVKHTLDEHSQSSSTLPWQSCGSCKVGFLCLTLYNQHLNTHCHSQIRRYRCRKCPGKFMWPENLQNHACSHRRAEKKILCTLCDAVQTSLAQLRVHLITHQNDLNGISLDYNSTFFRSFYPDGLDCSTSDLAARISEDFNVQDFDRYYNASTESGRELDLFDSETDESDEETRIYSCLLCGENTSTLASLLQHQKNIHSDRAANLPCPCDDCGSGFVSKDLLEQHRRQRCAKTHFRFQCHICNIRFVWQSNYELHLKTHHSKKHDEEELTTRLQCDECEKVFIWHKDLNRHKRLHQPQSAAPFDCPHCHRRFHRKDGLKSHLKVHAGEPDHIKELPFIPNVVNGITLSRLSRPHGCKLIRCMICLSTHSKISNLRTHMRSHQYELSFSEERDISSASKAFYPELENVLGRDELAGRIMGDVQQQLDLDRFVSITNEAGLELNLDSSETETESEQKEDQSFQGYACNLCDVVSMRKHQLYAHQLAEHKWDEAFLVCSHCQARFVNVSLQDHHSRTVCYNPQKVFQCRKCPLRFRWRENLQLHINLFHQQVEIPVPEDFPQADSDLQCDKCQRTFKMQKDLTRHTLMHGQESNIFRCRWCARRFYRKPNLLQHIARHGISVSQLPYAEAILDSYVNPAGQKKIECKVCCVSFPTIAALRLHLETMPTGSHHDLSSLQNYSITNQMGYEMELDDSETDDNDSRTHSKPPGATEFYTCGMCQLKCSRKFELYQHQQAMHRMEKIPDGCDRCIFKSVCPEIISHHKKTQCENREKQFKCTRCGYKFMWESNLLHHMQMHHEKPEDQQLDESKEATGNDPKADCQVFQCGLCTRKYNRKDRLTAHLKKFHGPDGKGSNEVRTSNRPTSPKEPKRFLCAFCGKAVSSSSNLIIHMRRHTGEKPFKCDYCTMAFPRSSDLQCHRRTHTGERPHVCTVCQKGFARSYKLQQHMRIHSGERPYKCTYCEKSFTQSNDLTLHIRRHTGERPYQCGVCGERFIQGTALKNHRMQQSHYEEGQESGEPPRRTVVEQFNI
ncbi:zinc finger protein Xfin [Drosophila eugracilis]|uniref:zinc finger protein Xfin n=1 Tax=Drosophila eugracilis TaxID=29029 RepID=UPI001BDB0DC0|nr:zinc finger protein Xfin [Drosophila eugracilis]